MAARRRASGWPAISAMNGSGNFPNDFTGASVRCPAMGVKVAVVGGGSTYTPELVEGFVTRAERLPVDELVLLDIDRDRLAVVGALAERIVRKAGWGGTVTLTEDREAAIDGADFVIVQLRVGGQPRAAARRDASPSRSACIGQETTGPGGFAKALRTVPVVLELAELTARTRRAGGVVRGLHEPDGPRSTQALLDARPPRDAGCATWRSGSSARWPTCSASRPSGCSSTTWGSTTSRGSGAVLVDGEDRLPELLAAPRPCDAVRGPPDRADPRDRRDPQLLPPLLLPAAPGDGEAPRGPDAGPRRSSRSKPVCSSCTAIPSSTTKPKLLEERGGACYSRRRRGTRRLAARGHRTTCRSSTCGTPARSRTCPRTTWSRCRAAWIVDGAHPIATAPAAPEMLGLVQHAKAYERLTIEAALSGSPVARLQGPPHEPAGGRLRTSPDRSSTSCSRPTASTSPGSSPRASPRGARRRAAGSSRAPRPRA